MERSCSNATTIKWRIQASELEGKMRVSMFSDLFHCHGARNMKLELRIDKHVDGTSDSLGDSSLYLWAPQGNRISFRLWVGVRSEVNIELNFLPKLRGARSRLYRRRILQRPLKNALRDVSLLHCFASLRTQKSAKIRQFFISISIVCRKMTTKPIAF